VKHPRLVVTNTTGWELYQELAEWSKLEILWSRLGIPVPEPLRKNIDDGEDLWIALVNAVHSGERADKEDEARAVVWRKHAKKDRRKLRRRLRRDGMPDPFELPDLGAADLNVWITEDQEPGWAAGLETDDEDAGSEPEAEIDVGQLLGRMEDETERDLVRLDQGPDRPEGRDGEVVARLYEALRTRLDAIERGEESLPDPAPDARRKFMAMEDARREDDGEDLEDFRNATAVAIGIGVLIREVEGPEAAPVSDKFIQALGPDPADPVSVTPRLMELASINRDFRGPPDSHGDPSYTGTDPLLLSLFAPGEGVWDAIAWWAEEFVRLRTMRLFGFAASDNRTESIRFGYLLACYLEQRPS